MINKQKWQGQIRIQWQEAWSENNPEWEASWNKGEVDSSPSVNLPEPAMDCMWGPGLGFPPNTVGWTLNQKLHLTHQLAFRHTIILRGPQGERHCHTLTAFLSANSITSPILANRRGSGFRHKALRRLSCTWQDREENFWGFICKTKELD